MTEYLADGPDWHLRSESRSGLPTFLCNRHANWFFDSFLPSGIQFLRIRELTKRLVDVQKTFPDVPDVSLIFGGSSSCRCDMKAGFNIPTNGGCLGNNPGGLVTCGFPLQVDSASIKSLESFIQFTSFCSS